MIGGVDLFTSKLGSAAGAFGGKPSASADMAGGTSFGDMLSAAAGDTVNSLRNAESVSVKALQGNADTREVVDAVMSAEQSLQAAVAIRDKIVSAYLEISRMSI